MEIVALWTGWLLVWALGVAVIALMRSPPATPVDAGEVPFLIGCGWFLGQFVLTLWMRLLSAAGVPFGVMTIGAPVAAVALVAGWIGARRSRGTGGIAGLLDGVQSAVRSLGGSSLGGLRRMAWVALLGWNALRLAILLFEVTIRPLYPWDAWTQWATKARVWYAMGTMVPFAGAPEWFALPTGAAYFDAAPHYPATIPLTQVWSATLLGQFDDALVNLPWWLTALALAFAIYGSLRFRRMTPLAALAGAWIVLSLPILDVHVALAGYADLAMAAYLTLAAVAWLRYADQRSPADLALAVLLSVACVLIKNPGKAWILTLVPGVAAAFLPRYRLAFAALFVAASAIVAFVLAQTSLTILGYRTGTGFRMPWRSLAEAYFAFANWHLLLCGVVAVGLLAWRRLLHPTLAPLTITIAAGLVFLAFGFAFTNAGAWVEDQATVNRATLHLAPLLALWMILAFHDWSHAPSASAGDN